MKWLKLAFLIFLVCSLSWAYLFCSGKVGYLVLNRRVTIEVNGAPVQGEMLEGRATAIVTRRDAGKEHSYRLFFAGDTDTTGDIGFVVDCHRWLAPHSSFLLETRRYPPCDARLEDGFKPWGWPLIDKSNSMLFVTNDRSTIRINRR